MNESLPLIDEYNNASDTAFGVILTFISIVGTIFNVASFVFFATQKAKNPNKIYFKRLYMVITINDTIICILLFPVIQAAFSPNRGRNTQGVLELPSLLFFNSSFCATWVIIWWSVTQLSVFLIAFLGVSRLLLLKYPQKQLHKTWLALALPIGFFISFAASWTVVAATGAQHPVYRQNILACILFPFSTRDIWSVASEKQGECL